MAKQDDLAGVEGPGVSAVKIKAVDSAFDELLGARKKRMEWGKKESEFQSVLLELMHKHELKVYTFDDVVYQRKAFEKVVRMPKDDNGADD